MRPTGHPRWRAHRHGATLLSQSAADGSGERVYIIVAYNDPNVEADLSAYRAEYGLPDCTAESGCFQLLNQEGATSPLPEDNADWATETALNTEMVSAICPNCGITVVEADDDVGNGLYDALEEAGTLGAKFVSIPWGFAETSDDTTMDSTYLKTSGVVYAAAAGDENYDTGALWPR